MSEVNTEEWAAVADLDDFKDTDRKLIDLGGEKQIGLFKVEGGYYAIDSWCSHQKMSLMEGPVTGHEIMCPLHGARFDLKTGQHLSFPAVKPVGSYQVKVGGDQILLKP
ncbi:MAG: Rieske 2Fe-2S domain-containing protein [Kiritimatiellae bacterium]|nr:Rieske 2Fe-2S domain-containing protein [Kiritimatiellia bacterium]